MGVNNFMQPTNLETVSSVQTRAFFDVLTAKSILKSDHHTRVSESLSCHSGSTSSQPVIVGALNFRSTSSFNIHGVAQPTQVSSLFNVDWNYGRS